jgi:hypothetical protein
MKLPSSRVLFTIGATIFLFGIAIVPAWEIIASVGGSSLVTTPFPFGDLQDVAVDAHGRIYVAEGLYHRVQRYSPEGNFQCGWFVPTSGAFALRATTDDRILVATARANKLLTYDSEGQLLENLTSQPQSRYEEFSSQTGKASHYLIRHGLIPRVIDTRTGQTILATPASERLVTGPFPAMLYAAIGLAHIGIAEWHRRRKPAVMKPPI